MEMFSILAIVALVATVLFLVRGIASMIRGGEADYEASTRFMLRRVEFQAAAVALVLAAGFFIAGWSGQTAATSDRLAVELGVLPATVLEQRYGPASPELTAYGPAPDDGNAYLVTIAIEDRRGGVRVADAEVSATVGRLGLSGTARELEPAEFGGAVTYGNYFRMPEPGVYQIDVTVDRPGSPGSDLVRLEYHRP